MSTEDSCARNREAASIVLGAPAYVPFEPRSAEQRALRSDLRQRLAALPRDPERLLYASFAGALPRGADVENALFYNLDARGVFTGLMTSGVLFERDPDPPAEGVRYTYEIAARRSAFRAWRASRDLATLNTTFGDERLTLAGIWWSLRSRPGALETTGMPRRDKEPFAISLEVSGPARELTPSLLKTILDGTISALQSQTDAPAAQMLAPLVAGTVGAPTDEVVRALLERRMSALGVRRSLLERHGTGIKWAPDDDCCAAARVLFAQAERWQISGRVALAAQLGTRSTRSDHAGAAL